jgi:lipopolysaccharide/colanic/teichoic acid biosynthesis glycosyltransferase
MRRLMDVVVALVVGFIGAPVIAVVTILVVASLGRPVLFRQERCGLQGKTFSVVKFRTMRDPAYPDEGDVERTPAIGRFLRASSLDELPQLWNILRGDMSVIGPRPTLPEQVACYSDHERGRLAVRPGLTGWAQINGRNGISWPARIELDLWYIAHRSLALDLKIVLHTALRVLRPSGVLGEGGVNPDFPGPAVGSLPTHPADGVGASVHVPPPRDGRTENPDHGSAPPAACDRHGPPVPPTGLVRGSGAESPGPRWPPPPIPPGRPPAPD